MHPSCAIACLPNHTLVDAMRDIREAGFSAVEFQSRCVQEGFAHHTEAIAHLRKLLGRFALHVSSMDASPLSAEAADQLPRDIEIVQREMHLARALGLSAVNVGTGSRQNQPIELVVEGLREIVQIANELGMQVNVANRRGSRIELPSDVRYVLAEINADNVRLLLDSGQFHSTAVNPCDVLCEFPNRIGIIHITDQIGRKPVPLGQGEMNVPAIVERAFRMQYEGWIVLSNPLPKLADPIRYLGDARTYLESLLASLRLRPN
jgi:sugar phosphate isomerase/epimerase